MTRSRGATLFSGGGGCETLLKDTVDFVHAVEYDPAIAEVYRANHGDHITVGDVCDVDYSAWGALDYLHASPVCKNFSAAKANGVESDEDMQTALAVVRCMDATQPRVFTLENVGQYQGSASYRAIVGWLNQNGYMWHAEVLNSADFGVPQTRRRLILRAVKDALLPSLPNRTRWVGWYEAIEDLIPGLPDSQFAAWQLARLPELNETALVRGDNSQQEITPERQYRRVAEPSPTVRTALGARAFIVSNAKTEYGDGLRDSAEPMLSVTAQHGGRLRAWLVDCQDAGAVRFDGERGLTMRSNEQPRFTVSASMLPRRPARAWLNTGRVVKMTPRALARFQSFPDSYVLPDKAGLACTVIGNAVPPLLMRAIVRGLR